MSMHDRIRHQVLMDESIQMLDGMGWEVEWPKDETHITLIINYISNLIAISTNMGIHGTMFPGNMDK